MNLALRSTENELMDDPAIQSHTLERVFEDINRANILLGGDTVTIKTMLKLMHMLKKKSYTIIDVGCGDGHILRELVKTYRKHKINARCIGLELREDVVAIAQSKSGQFPEISYEIGDIFELDARAYECDIILCTLTLHHFDNDAIPKLLNKLTAMAKEAVIINDLHRSPLSCHLFKLFRFFFLKTPEAKHDGLVSIKRGFKRKELLAFTKKIPNAIHTISWRWAFRYVWILKPKSV